MVEVLDTTVYEWALRSSYYLHIAEVDYCTLCFYPVFLNHKWCCTLTTETTHSSCHELYKLEKVMSVCSNVLQCNPNNETSYLDNGARCIPASLKCFLHRAFHHTVQLRNHVTWSVCLHRTHVNNCSKESMASTHSQLDSVSGSTSDSLCALLHNHYHCTVALDWYRCEFLFEFHCHM